MDIKNYGLKFDEYKEGDYFLGGGFLGTKEILPSGDWTPFCPIAEYQNKGFETNACTRYGTLNALEILFSFVLKEDKNFSDRYLSIVAGGSRNGDTPNNIGKAMTTKGLVDEIDLPNDNSIDSNDKFYSPDPMTSDLLVKGREFLENYSIGHEWVFTPGKIQSIEEQNNIITEALKRSPVGLSVSAWSSDGKGGFDQKWPENHWCVIVKRENEDYWKIYDSYDKIFKLYSTKSKITMAKIYTVAKKSQEDKETIFTKFINWVLSIINKEVTTDTVKPIVEPVKKSDITIGIFCLAIQEFEGYVKPGEKGRDGKIYPYGSRSYRNCNPGNLKYVNNMYLTVGQDQDGFAKFKSYQDGFMALSNKIKKACNGESTVYKPDDTILEFFQKYAPTYDGNYPEKYAKFVADKLKVGISFKIKNLI